MIKLREEIVNQISKKAITQAITLLTMTTETLYMYLKKILLQLQFDIQEDNSNNYICERVTIYPFMLFQNIIDLIKSGTINITYIYILEFGESQKQNYQKRVAQKSQNMIQLHYEIIKYLILNCANDIRVEIHQGNHVQHSLIDIVSSAQIIIKNLIDHQKQEFRKNVKTYIIGTDKEY